MRHRLVVMGGSAGAIEALAEIVHQLPPDLDAAVAVVVHFPQTEVSALPQILNRAGRLPATHAVDGEPICPGRIVVAPPGYHLRVRGGHFHLTRGPRENGNRPALDPLFRSAAAEFGAGVIGVVLTGNLDDGTAGLAEIQRHGGIAVVQDPATASFPGMPASAVAHVPVDYIEPLDGIAARIAALVAADPMEARMAGAQSGNGEQGGNREEPRPGSVAKVNGRASGFTCPECHGALWEQRNGDLLRYECRVGHAYSAESLVAEHAEDLEQALWTALRALEEHAAIARRLADTARQAGHERSASSYIERAVDCEHHAAIIRRTLERLNTRADEEQPAE